MAEATGLRQSLPYPVYGAPFGFVIPITEADGDLVTSAAGLDSEISKNGDTLTDCTNEATEIGGGLYYLLLTATEMTADVVSGVTKTSTADAKTTSWSLYPRKLVTVRSGTAAGGDTGYITLDASASAVDDYYNGMVCIATIDSTVEARIITDYTGSSKQAAVTPAWNTAPDSDDTFVLKLPEGVQLPTVPSAADNATAAAAAILVTPANKLETDASGHVSISGTKNTLDDLATAIQGADGDTLETLSDQLDAIKAKTDDIGAAGAGLTAIPWNAAWDAEVQSEVADALNAYDPPTNAEMVARTLVAASYFDPAADTVANVTTVGAVTTVSDKTGYALASDGLDAIDTTAPSGVATNFREMVVQVWRRFFKKATMTSTALKTYADDGATEVTSQTLADDGTTQTQGAAS